MSSPTEKPLEERARRFAALYRGKGSGAQAARGAGYKGDPKTIAVTAHRLAHDPRVLAEIDRVHGEAVRARAGASAPTVVDSSGEPVVEAAPAPLPKLRAQHAAFVDAWVECGVYAEAAARAGYAGGAKSLRNRGAALAKRPDIAAHLAAARRELEANAIADRNELEALLTAIARGKGGEAPRDRISAIRTLARMQGHDGPSGGLGAYRGGPTLPEPPAGSSGAAVFVWKGNGRGPSPEEV